MARHPRNNVDYFPHPVTHKKKMFFIERKYRNDGYATWFKILEVLGDNNYHFIDLMNDVDVMHLASKCDVSEETLFSIINDLVKLGEFEKDLWENEKILFNQDFIDSVKDAYKCRDNACVTKNELLGILEAKGRTKPSKLPSKPSKVQSELPGNTQRRVKKSKVEKTRLGSLAGTRQCPHEKIIEIYQNECPELPAVRQWGDTSRKNLRARWREDSIRQDTGWWETFFRDYIQASDFLMGRKKDFQASLGWIVRPANFEKILNGLYKNRGPNTGSARSDKNLQVCKEFINAS